MPDTENIPRTIGRYEVRRQLGAGAMGCVYLAEDPRIKRKLAIKVVKLDAMRSEEDRREYLARFQREAEVSGVLNDPGIVTIYDVGDSDMGPFLAMEYVQGQPLDGLIKSGRLPAMPLRAKLRIACGVAAALDHAHAHNIVHRDVKPGNVILTEDGRPKLMDFGIAKREDASLTQTGTFLGTPSYASPEQIKEGHATLLSDVFSFGVMIFELLSGTLPFPGTSINTILYRIVNEQPVEVNPPVAGLLPDAWQRIFLRVLSKNPGERHPSCSAFVRELIEAATELDPSVRTELLGLLRQGAVPLVMPPTPITRTLDDTQATSRRRIRPGSRGVLYGGILAGLVVLGLGFFLFSGKAGEEVRLTTDPPQATLAMNGQVLDANKPLIMKEGDRLEIRKPGFVTAQYVHGRGDKAPRIVLQPVLSEVRLRTDPPGAEVVLDSRKLQGATPLVIKDWNQGQLHDLTFTHPQSGVGLSTRFDVGEVPGDKVFKLLPLDELRTTGETGNVVSSSTGVLKLAGGFTARVKVDGKDVGGGARLSLAPGSHRIDLANPKVFYQETRTVQITAGQTVTVALPDLARLTVSTFPSSGTIVIDGVPTEVESDGSTAIPVVKGRHTISIQGREGSSRTIEVDKETLELNFKI
ncbi:MAG TPA: serine/threonine-protein kinase [Holophaga sp.]|nr:serine/threonine-protein kinase [Holophaga sp.]HPS66458.1 serine/threonine-protein kinase [Holophaga sp.]